MKLVSGSGSVSEGACWASAIKWYTESGNPNFKWGDDASCIDPVIRALCIDLNDVCLDGERERIIGPHLFAPVGTNQGIILSSERAFRVADWAVRKIAPTALRLAKLDAEAAKLEMVTTIVDKKSARAAMEVARAAADVAWAAAAAADVAWAAQAAACSAARATEAAVAAAVGATQVAAQAALGARQAALAAAGATRSAAGFAGDVFDYKQSILDLILELCAMGAKPVKEACSKEMVLECLEKGF